MESASTDARNAAKKGIIGYVLAGGSSSRMGRDKAHLCIGESTLTHLAVTHLMASGVDKVVISSNECGIGLADKIPRCGPLSAIHSIINEAWANQYTGMLILPVDMPLIQTSHLKMLIQHGLSFATSCCFKQRYLPAFIPFTKQLESIVQQQMSTGDYAVKNMLVKLDYQALTLPVQAADEKTITAFYNVNTPEQWQRLIEAPQIQILDIASLTEDS